MGQDAVEVITAKTAITKEVGRNQLPQIRKANEAIAIRPMSGKLSFLAKKILNVLIYHAQQQGDRESYTLPLADFVTDVSFDSHDVALLKDCMRGMIRTEIEWNDPGKEWGISTLVSEASFTRRGRTSTVEWSFSPKIKKRLLRPDRYTKFTLKYQSIFKSLSGLTLLEICLSQETNPAHLTERAPPLWWHSVLTGVPESQIVSHDYRYLKRDILNPAIKEINALTHIDVELVEHKVGRKVIEVQFRVSTKAQGALNLPPPPLIDSAVIDRIVSLGISKKDAIEIYGANSDEKVREKLAMTESRVANTKLVPISSPAAFFRAALKNNYQPATPKRLPRAPAFPDEKPAIEDAAAKAAREHARSKFAELDETQRAVVLQSFEVEVVSKNSLIGKAFAKNGLKAKVVDVALVDWLVSKTVTP